MLTCNYFTHLSPSLDVLRNLGFGWSEKLSTNLTFSIKWSRMNKRLLKKGTYYYIHVEQKATNVLVNVVDYHQHLLYYHVHIGKQAVHIEINIFKM